MGGWKDNRREKEREWEGGRITRGRRCKRMPVLDKKYKSILSIKVLQQQKFKFIYHRMQYDRRG